MTIAEQMGTALRNTAYSVNIKERLDFSCALFDPTGALHRQCAANALSIWGRWARACARSWRVASGQLAPGQALYAERPVPWRTHLPDVTVIMPVFDEDDPTALLFFRRRARSSGRYRRHHPGFDAAPKPHAG